MKKLALSVGVPLACVLSLTQCENIVETEPLGSLSDETFYQTERDFDAATLAPYSTILNLTYDQFGRGWLNAVFLPSDDVQYRDPNNALDVFNWTAVNGDFAWIWENAYKGVLRSNVVLQQLPLATGFADEANKPRYEAEAKFTRAYWYFILARNWGNVPIVTEVFNDVAATQVGNSQPGEVWDLIEADLEYAAENLPADYGNQKGRATRYSALALLGKVELYRAQWFNNPAKYQEAIEHFQAVVQSGRFMLVDNYNANFTEATENNAESLFEVQMTEGDNINAWGTTDTGGAAGWAWPIYVSPSCYYAATTTCAPKAWGHGYGQVDITPSLQAVFEQDAPGTPQQDAPGDPRRMFTYYAQGDVYFDGPCDHDNLASSPDLDPCLFNSAWSRTGSTPSKYNKPFDPNRFPNNLSTNNIRVIRYADVLLMLAEAQLLGNGNAGPELVNQVRARARRTYEIVNGTPAPAGVVPPLASVSFADIMRERRLELSLEFHRYDDLVRWHRAGLINIPTDIEFGYPEANENWSETNLLKPIPQRELDLNENLTQNPGY